MAWDEVKSATIIKSWRKIINTQNTEHHRKSNEGSNELFDLIMKLPLSEPINLDVHDWINVDKRQETTDAMILNIFNKENEPSNGDEASEDEIRHMKISHTDGLKAIQSANEYIEQEVTSIILLSSKKMVKHCCRKHQSNITQKTIKDFFKR